MKQCKKCLTTKTFESFWKRNDSKDGRRNICIDCVNSAILFRDKTIVTEKKCTNCQTIKKSSFFHKDRREKDNLRNWCKECQKTTDSKEDRVKKRKITTKAWHKNAYQKNSQFKLRKLLSNSLNHHLNGKKASKSILECIGCNLEQLKFHLQNQFQPGMTWENHSQFGWHIDHIIPVSNFLTEEDIKKSFHYTNLQPLWWYENIKKSNNYEF